MIVLDTLGTPELPPHPAEKRTLVTRPSFQFYPADWLKNTALQLCSVAAQGLWINMMCIAHDCQPYGHLTTDYKPMNPAQIARLTRLGRQQSERLLAELRDAGVFSETADGTIFSPRMVRDEVVRNNRGAAGFAGGEHGIKGAKYGVNGGRPPRQPQGGASNPPSVERIERSNPPNNPPPSSSFSPSSTSSSPKIEEPDSVPDGTGAGGAVPPALSLVQAKLKLTDPDEIIFGYGVPLLVHAGTPDKAARSFLGKLRKLHGDAPVIEKLRFLVAKKPAIAQPLEWLAKALPPPVSPEHAAQAEADRRAATTEAARKRVFGDSAPVDGEVFDAAR